MVQDLKPAGHTLQVDGGLSVKCSGRYEVIGNPHKHTFTFGGTFAFHSLDHSLFTICCVDEEASWVGGWSHPIFLVMPGNLSGGEQILNGMERIEVSSSFENSNGNKSIFHRCVRGLISSFTVLNVHPSGLGEKGQNGIKLRSRVSFPFIIIEIKGRKPSLWLSSQCL
ncbi:hypothetical protein DVH24_003566 [Malus domestica]|uniref:Uncharacterized protein n=1 Tax=Malus domestica TaxID=3750 RepID=A0A498IHH3_MALDO|nr:hypothetical protein DVH24_003566 [Malus domestica]